MTYDSAADSSQLSYFFGSGSAAAQPDLVADYVRGPVAQSGALTLGNFGTVVGARTELGPNGGSRVLRGLVDELNLLSRALSLAEIQAIQKAKPRVPVSAPTLTARASNGQIVIAWPLGAGFQLQALQDLGGGASWTDVTTQPTPVGNQQEVRLPIEGAQRFYRLRD